jgi:hypothetical protein
MYNFLKRKAKNVKTEADKNGTCERKFMKKNRKKRKKTHRKS